MRNNPDGNEKLCQIVYTKHENQTEQVNSYQVVEHL